MILKLVDSVNSLQFCWREFAVESDALDAEVLVFVRLAYEETEGGCEAVVMAACEAWRGNAMTPITDPATIAATLGCEASELASQLYWRALE